MESATPDGAADCFGGVARIDWARMLYGLSYAQSHIVDNLLYCSLDPPLLGRGVAKSSEFSILGARGNLVENQGTRQYLENNDSSQP